MHIALLMGEWRQPERWFRGTGFRPRRATPLDPPTLTPGTEGLVAVVEAGFLEDAGWPGWRTRLQQAHRRFVVAGERLTPPLVVKAMRDGAHDCVELPASEKREGWKSALGQAAAAQSAWLSLYGVAAPAASSGPVGISPAFLALMETVRQVGPTPASVLLLGETGTGKEEMARALHACRPPGPFVALNCAAIPRELLESELFGVVAGAYTGARAPRPGLVEQADGGTLFLDELPEMEMALQPKLLRFLETRTARRLGDKKDYHVDVRVIAAGNRLRGPEGRPLLREDLFYRLAEFQIQLPPLRERPEDVPVLAMHFLGQASERFGKYFDALDPDLVQALQSHVWPGNARELRHVIDRMAVLQDGPVLRWRGWEVPKSPPVPAVAAVPVPAVVAPVADAPPAPGARPPTGAGGAAPLPAAWGASVRPQVYRLSKAARKAEAKRLLEESGGDLAWTAQALGVHPATFYRWRKRWGWLDEPPAPAR